MTTTTATILKSFGNDATATTNDTTTATAPSPPYRTHHHSSPSAHPIIIFANKYHLRLIVDHLTITFPPSSDDDIFLLDTISVLHHQSKPPYLGSDAFQRLASLYVQPIYYFVF